VTLQLSGQTHSILLSLLFDGNCCACIHNLRGPSYLSTAINMARHAQNLNAMIDLTSFSSEERFSYSTDGGFRVAIPRITEWDYHPRAKISELKAHLLADLKLTRRGRLSQYQPDRPVEQDYRYLRILPRLPHHTYLFALQLVVGSAHTLWT
jgi:hypothetical protein